MKPKRNPITQVPKAWKAGQQKGKPLISREWLKALLREPGRTVLRWYCVDLSTLPWHLITCEDGG